MTRPVSCSPRPRGCSLHGARRRRAGRVLPALPGMVPHVWPARSSGAGAPRARGDGPMGVRACPSHSPCSPAPAGMVPAPRPVRHGRCSAPRAREDGLASTLVLALSRGAPRTGMVPPRCLGYVPGSVLPAPAGMVPLTPRFPRVPVSAPRACGDGPKPNRFFTRQELCSPRPRGMVPCSSHRRTCATCAPRARGDGPPRGCETVAALRCSLRPRG